MTARWPSAFEAEHPPAPPADCPNCGTAVAPEDTFCRACGQRQDLTPPTVAEFARAIYDHHIAGGGKLGHSLRRLLWPPGQATIDWLEGRRARHVPPLRLYIGSAFLLFTLLRLLPLPLSEGETSATGTAVAAWVESARAWVIGAGLGGFGESVGERAARVAAQWRADPASAAAATLARGLDVFWLLQFVTLPCGAFARAARYPAAARLVGPLIVVALHRGAIGNLVGCFAYASVVIAVSLQVQWPAFLTLAVLVPWSVIAWLEQRRFARWMPAPGGQPLAAHVQAFAWHAVSTTLGVAGLAAALLGAWR